MQTSLPLSSWSCPLAERSWWRERLWQEGLDVAPFWLWTCFFKKRNSFPRWGEKSGFPVPLGLRYEAICSLDVDTKSCPQIFSLSALNKSTGWPEIPHAASMGQTCMKCPEPGLKLPSALPAWLVHNFLNLSFYNRKVGDVWSLHKRFAHRSKRENWSRAELKV